jgi:Ca-activated chloride channel homolog
MRAWQIFFETIVPTARRRIPSSGIWLLVGFLLAYAGLMIGLAVSERILFVHPWAFCWMLVAPWIWWMQMAGHAGLSPMRGAISSLLRLTLVGLFVMVLAEPRGIRSSDALSVMYAVDLSDSIGSGSTDAALKLVTETVSKKPERDSAGLIVFGRNAAVELPPRLTFPLEAVNSRVERDATNIAKSLSLAGAVLPEENPGRIVLITDGVQTEGALDTVLDDLRSRGVGVDIVPIDYEYDTEVWLERLELPNGLKVGENYEAAVILSSLKPGQGVLALSENGQEIHRTPVTFQKGKNRYVIPMYLRSAGYYEYSATILCDAEIDHIQDNNVAMDYVFIEGNGKVLIVTDPQGDERDWAGLVESLQRERREVEVRSAYELPRDAQSILPYDCVLLVNAPADAMDGIQMKALRDAVYDYGVGLLMVGGSNSFGPGGFRGSPIEEALPVSMDIPQKKILPKGALAIILHTCEFPEGNTWGKRITKQAMQVLNAQDEVGVLAYGTSGEAWVFKLSPAGDYEKLAPSVNGAQIGDMPSFTNTMQMALEELKLCDAAAKHVIIISDGDPSPPPPKLIADYIAHKVSVSMVAIFPHGGQDISKMRSIAGATGGRYYFPADPNELPSIFIKEAKTLQRTMVQTRTFTPELGFPSPVLKGIDSVPQLKGYVLTSLKPRAMAALQATMEENGQKETDPILAEWRFGLGTTAAFTSDLSPLWGADWLAWERRGAFITQLVTQIARVRQESNLRIFTEVQGTEAVIVVEDFHPQETFLDITARVSGPRDRTESLQLKQVAPRRYQSSLPLWGKGRYQVLATTETDRRTDRALGGFIVSYSPEYLRFRANPILLKKIAEATHGEQLSPDDAAEKIYGRRVAKTSTRRLFDLLLAAAAILIPLDVGLRRIQWDWSVVRSWFRRETREKGTPVMESLLARKREVESRLDTGAKQDIYMSQHKPVEDLPQKPPAVAPDASSSLTSPEATPTPASPPTSTTEKLLELKRKRGADPK